MWRGSEVAGDLHLELILLSGFTSLGVLEMLISELKSGLDLSNSSLAVVELGKLERSLSEALRSFHIGTYNLAR
ncbi:MAG: hypothetical protein QW680_01240 [Pyrobaculum sp.]|uniref:hypothetical protein n=1 Tax=Pyrobaculum aerophilum TaxID=13773 RepID=UPI002FD8C6D4